MTNLQLILDAISNLRPNSEFSIIDGKIIFKDPSVLVPSEFEINETVKLLNYKKLRESEYPDFKDYLDGVVKGDQVQIDKYIADCLAVKAKYPKEELNDN